MELLILIGIGVVIWLVSESDKKRYSTYTRSYSDQSNATKSSRKNRATYCHSCKSSLTSSNDKECANCGWLICSICGACEYNCSKSKSQANKAIALGAATLVSAATSAKDNYGEDYDDNEVYDTFSDYGYDEYESSYDSEPEIDTSIDEGYAEEIDWEDRY
ncbi:hypothetical protein GTH32_18260 [Alteromonas sp. 345S023]|uniref:Uncharacterized protein n=1 Tax=Alteromonas profundi TaxID=2696062 RepID=A0A7X5LPF0_9ALTE|nr:hypothetical protein [Alteromonas profundi]NDV93116.1 hypothetical protein [Alteromonas profundi]